VTDDDSKFDTGLVEPRVGDELGGTEYRCGDCGEVFWSPYAASAVEHCPKCGDASIEATGLALVGTLDRSQSYKSWWRAQVAVEQARREERDGGGEQ